MLHNTILPLLHILPLYKPHTTTSRLPYYVTIIERQKSINQKGIVTACANVADDVPHRANRCHARLTAIVHCKLCRIVCVVTQLSCIELAPATQVQHQIPHRDGDAQTCLPKPILLHGHSIPHEFVLSVDNGKEKNLSWLAFRFSLIRVWYRWLR